MSDGLATHDEALKAEVEGLIDQWRRVFGLTDHPITVLVEDKPFGDDTRVAACLTQLGNTESIVSVRRDWARSGDATAALKWTLESIVVHELIHIMFVLAGADEIRHAIKQQLISHEAPELLQTAISESMHDLDEQLTLRTTVALMRARGG